MGKAAQRKKTARKPLIAPEHANPAAFFTQAEADAARRLTHGDQSARTPSAVLAAFVEGAEPLVVAGYTIPAIGLGRYMLIERIQSPIMEPGGMQKITNPQLAELIFVCTQPEKTSRALLAQGGTAFADAVADFADGVPLDSLSAIGEAIGLRLAQAISTLISPASSGEGSGAGVEKKTAPASASPTKATG